MKFKSKNHRLHYEMWDEIVKRDCKKEETETFKKYKVPFECYACEEAGRKPDTTLFLEKHPCPIKWGGSNQCEDNVFDEYHACLEQDGSFFVCWENAKTRKTRTKYAKLIRDAKWTVRKK